MTSLALEQVTCPAHVWPSPVRTLLSHPSAPPTPYCFAPRRDSSWCHHSCLGPFFPLPLESPQHRLCPHLCPLPLEKPLWVFSQVSLPPSNGARVPVTHCSSQGPVFGVDMGPAVLPRAKGQPHAPTSAEPTHSQGGPLENSSREPHGKPVPAAGCQSRGLSSLRGPRPAAMLPAPPPPRGLSAARSKPLLGEAQASATFPGRPADLAPLLAPLRGAS